jgi:ribonucleoside-triphosphate reductase
VLVTFPVKWDDVPFDRVDGKEVNLESALDQLERYKMIQTSWTQQNTSVTISYDPSEVEDIKHWLLNNWDCYVGVSFLFRSDPTKTAKDLGYLYLPQEVVDEQTYHEYTQNLLPVDINTANSFEEIVEEGCATGACPIK